MLEERNFQRQMKGEEKHEQQKRGWLDASVKYLDKQDAAVDKPDSSGEREHEKLAQEIALRRTRSQQIEVKLLEENRVVELFAADKISLKNQVKERIEHAGGKPRKDSVENVSFILSASHEWFEPDAAGNFNQKKVDAFTDHTLRFFRDWKEDGMTPVRAVLQLDERTPHVHVTCVPFDPTGKLNCKHHLGGQAKLYALHDRLAEYYEPIGIKRGEIGRRASFEDVNRYEEHKRRTEPGEYYRKVCETAVPLTLNEFACLNGWTTGKAKNKRGEDSIVFYGREDFCTTDPPRNNPLYMVNQQGDKLMRAARGESGKLRLDTTSPLDRNDVFAVAQDYYRRTFPETTEAQTIAHLTHQIETASRAGNPDAALNRAQAAYLEHQKLETQRVTAQVGIARHEFYVVETDLELDVELGMPIE